MLQSGETNSLGESSVGDCPHLVWNSVLVLKGVPHSFPLFKNGFGSQNGFEVSKLGFSLRKLNQKHFFRSSPGMVQSVKRTSKSNLSLVIQKFLNHSVEGAFIPVHQTSAK